MKLVEKIFGTHSERELKLIESTVDQVESYRDAMHALSDSELKDKTKEFKKRYADGETLDDLLPEAYAVVREAAVRELYEETGLKAKPEDLKFAGLNDGVKENRQNITLRYVIEMPEKVLISHLENVDLRTDIRGGEKNEVDELTLVPYFYARENADDFAFGHADVMKEIIDNYEKIKAGGYYKDSLDRK